jgi:hypothetical protein
VKLLSADELWPNDVYQSTRDEYRRRIIALKQPRRVGLGDSVTLIFENRDTLRFQVQEMMRTEGLTDQAAIQGELDVYNALMPGPNELSATLMIEVVDEARIREVLQRLVGIEESLALSFGLNELRAQFEGGHSDGSRISAVQYLRFQFTPAQREAFLETPQARLELRHPAYKASVELGAATLGSLKADLTRD